MQLADWVSSPQEPPAVTWLSGLFNPQSFLTAIMQVMHRPVSRPVASNPEVARCRRIRFFRYVVRV